MKIDLKFITEEEIAKLKPKDTASSLEILIPKISVKRILLFIIIGGFLFNQVLMWRMDSSNFLREQVLSFGKKLFNINITITKK